MIFDDSSFVCASATPGSELQGRTGPTLEDCEAALGRIAGASILLVEDNEINQLVACEMLRGAGFEVDVADNGQLAVQAVAARFAQ